MGIGGIGAGRIFLYPFAQADGDADIGSAVIQAGFEHGVQSKAGANFIFSDEEYRQRIFIAGENSRTAVKVAAEPYPGFAFVGKAGAVYPAIVGFVAGWLAHESVSQFS